MSLLKRISTSTNLALPANTILFGIHLDVVPDVDASAPTTPVNIKLYDSATQTGTVLFEFNIGTQMDSFNPSPVSFTFPAGVRFGKGVSVTVTAVNYTTVNFMMDYS